jgi:hypothetical protein
MNGIPVKTATIHDNDFVNRMKPTKLTNVPVYLFSLK